LSSNLRFSAISQIDLNNLRIMLKGEAANKVTGVMSVNELRDFLVRFGPLHQIVFRIRAFINDGAANWYHGIILREEAESRLYTYSIQNSCQACFLIRAAPVQSGRDIPNSLYVFTLSYFITNNLQTQFFHTRLYLNQIGQLCVPNETEMGYCPATFVNFSECLKFLVHQRLICVGVHDADHYGLKLDITEKEKEEPQNKEFVKESIPDFNAYFKFFAK